MRLAEIALKVYSNSANRLNCAGEPHALGTACSSRNVSILTTWSFYAYEYPTFPYCGRFLQILMALSFKVHKVA